MIHKITQSIEILLVEDNEADVDLIKETLNQSKRSIHLHVTRNGEEAMAFLKRQDIYIDAPRPNLILLDLNLPKKDGREVLRETKENPDLCQIPIVILTSSAAEEDICESYQLHANCYIIKPLDFESFGKVIQQLLDFWFSLIVLYQKGRSNGQ